MARRAQKDIDQLGGRFGLRETTLSLLAEPLSRPMARRFDRFIHLVLTGGAPDSHEHAMR